MHDEITVVCFGVKYFKYMFWVRGPPMAQMLARLVELWVAAPARSNYVIKRGFPEASSVAIITGRPVRPSRFLPRQRSEYYYCRGIDSMP